MISSRKWLNDTQWGILKPILLRIRNTQGPSKRQDDRAFLNAVAYLVTTNKTWRELPAELGSWHSVYMRFRRWEDSRIWARIRAEIDDRNAEKFQKFFQCENYKEKKCIWKKHHTIKERLLSAFEQDFC
jgi:transposase